MGNTQSVVLQRTLSPASEKRNRDGAVKMAKFRTLSSKFTHSQTATTVTTEVTTADLVQSREHHVGVLHRTPTYSFSNSRTLANASVSDLAHRLTHPHLLPADFEQTVPATSLLTTQPSFQERLSQIDFQEQQTRDDEFTLLKRPSPSTYVLDWSRKDLLHLNPSIASYFPNLVALDLTNNLLTDLPEDLGRLTRLKKLGLGYNYLYHLPESIGELKSLIWIDMTGNRLSTLPDSFVQLTKLLSLGLSECRFKEFPRVLCQMRQLSKVGVFNNVIEYIPPEIGNLINLQKLDLSGNMIKELPDEFCQLHNLTWLNLSGNKLRCLPEKFGHLRGLQSISLSSNRLESLPDSFSLLDSLTILPIFCNQLKEIGSWIGGLKSLNRLDASENQLERIAKEVFMLPNLDTLVLRSNQLVELPDFHHYISAILQHHNGRQEKKITRVSPESSYSLHSSLKLIDLRENVLVSLPVCISRLPALQVLLVGGSNPWMNLADDDVFGTWSQSVPNLHELLINRFILSPRRLEAVKSQEMMSTLPLPDASFTSSGASLARQQLQRFPLSLLPSHIIRHLPLANFRYCDRCETQFLATDESDMNENKAYVNSFSSRLSMALHVIEWKQATHENIMIPYVLRVCSIECAREVYEKKQQGVPFSENFFESLETSSEEELQATVVY